MGGKVSKSSKEQTQPIDAENALQRVPSALKRVPSAGSLANSSFGKPRYSAPEVEQKGQIHAKQPDDGQLADDGLTDEERDDAEVVRLLFDEIDENKNGLLSREEIDNYLHENFTDDALCSALLSLTANSESIAFPAFKEAVRLIPRVVGQRVHWVGQLKIEAELAKHLKPGTVFDGLKGIREDMTLEDVKKACKKFCEAVPGLVIRGWESLRTKRSFAAKEVNSKFAMSEGAVKGSFGTLEDFYKGPEARIGHPNPKLYEAMEKEHTRRSNATKLFCTPNYLVATCTQWEWQWIISPDSPQYSSLKERLAQSNGKYPGEIGDCFSETAMNFEIQLQSNVATDHLVKALEGELGPKITEQLSKSPEAASRGIRLTEMYKSNPNLMSLTITVPALKDTFDPDMVKQAVAQIAGVDADKVMTKKIVTHSHEYCECTDPKQFEALLEANQGMNVGQTPPLPIASAVKAFVQQTDDWAKSGRFRKQGRKRQVGDIDDFVSRPELIDIIKGANLRKEEIIALRLYSGPNYLLYNATLRAFPPRLLESLDGNRLETTIFVIISGLVKLSKVTKIPPNRFLYRGLGGMLVPDEFWRPSLDFQGGVELGLMSTTMDKRVAIQYSGLEKKRAVIFEIMAGRIDIGGSLGSFSQYPGEAEYLMPPLTCLEVMGKPRVEMTDKGEVIVFPMRANVNLKSITVEQLENRRKELHMAIITNLQEELFQWLEATEAEAETSYTPEKLNESLIPSAVSNIKKEFAEIFERHQVLETQIFNDEDKYKELMVEAIDAKVLAMRKMSFFRKQVDDTWPRWDTKFLDRIMTTSLKEFSKEGIELQMRTGIDNFPWQDVVAKKPSIELGSWSPTGLEAWKLDKTRAVLSQNEAIRGVTIKGHVIPFQQGIMAEEIILDNQPVKGVAAELGFVLSINDRLTSLSLRGTGLDFSDWSIILEALKGCRRLSRINNGDFSDALSEGLVTLDLRGRSIDREGAAVVAGLLARSSSTLTCLNLAISPQNDKVERKCGNDISKEGGTAIAEGLRFVTGLRTLNLSSNGLSKEGGAAIAASICYCTALQILDLHSNSLGKEGGTAIATSLRYLTCLQTLELQSNDLSRDGAAAIGDALQFVKTLQTLDISSNRLSKEGGTAISSYLRQVSTLLTLNLNSNALSKEGATAIAEDLRHISCLQTLDLQGNDLAREGGTAIGKGLRQVPNLQLLNVSFNTLLKEGGTAIAEGLRSVPSLRSLNLGSNNLSKEGATAVADGLRFVTALSSLDLSWNEISNEGGMAIAEALRFSTVLQTLNLRFNRIDADGEWRIRNKLTVVKSLLLTT